MEEKEVVEKQTDRREKPLDKVTNVNVGPDGSTDLEESADDVVVEEHVIEEHRRP